MKGVCQIELREKLVMLFLDIFIILLGFMTANKVVHLLEQSGGQSTFWSGAGINVLPPFIIFPATIYIFELYKPDRWRHTSRLLTFVATAVTAAVALMAICSFFFPAWFPLDRKVVILHMVITIGLLFFVRKLAHVHPLLGNLNKNILLVGCHDLLNEICTLLNKNHYKRYSSITWIKPCCEKPEYCGLIDPDTGEHLTSLIKNKFYSTMVLSEDLLKIEGIKQLLPGIRLSGARIYDPFNFYEALTNKVAIHHIEPSWFLFHNQGASFNPRIYLKIKKIFETLATLLLIALLSPMFLLITLAIAVFDGLPVLFCQERIGQDEKTFTLYKYRTMKASSQSTFIPAWQQTDTTRNTITPLGRILRKTRLDELPQLLNILKGDMSFIGPRPIRPAAADILKTQIPFYAWRFAVKPGLTGWAQINSGYGDTLDGQIEKLQYDLYYIQNQSVILDLLIVIKTIRSILFLQGQ